MVKGFFFPSCSDSFAGRLCTILHIVSVNYTQLYKMNHIYHFSLMNIHSSSFCIYLIEIETMQVSKSQQ